MIRTLIVPCLTSNLSPVFEYNKETCSINCVYVISEMDIRCFDEIYFIVLDSMNKKYRLVEKIMSDMSRIEYYTGKFKVIQLPEVTSSPAETIYKAIKAIGADRSLFIKDADNMFENQLLPLEDAVMTASLEETPLVDTMHKSYVRLDEQGFITNAIEKRVISDQFIAGGYSFKNAQDFIEAYEALKQVSDKFYISDMIFWLILNKDSKFRPIKADKFNDLNI